MGAARLLRGLTRVVDPDKLTVIVNTGDDDEFYGLHVSPDLDTITYTLADLAPQRQGWGIRGDTFNARGGLDRLYGPGWFALGDQDLATHIYRTQRLREGATLSRTTREICGALGVDVAVLPATDDRLRTEIETKDGRLAFQEYLVRERARPRVRAVRLRGARASKPAPGVIRAIDAADVVVIAPSNPYVSVGPIVAVPGIKEALRRAKDRTVAVSPLIGGRAVKGPLAEMLRSMGERADTPAIARYYSGLAGTLIVAPGDKPARVEASWPRILEHETLMKTPAVAARLARCALEAGEVARHKARPGG